MKIEKYPKKLKIEISIDSTPLQPNSPSVNDFYGDKQGGKN